MLPRPGLQKRILTATNAEDWRALGRETATPEGYGILIKLLGSPHATIAKRAGYVFAHTAEVSPALTVAHLPALVPLLDADVHPATRRALVRALTFIDLPADWLGPVLDRCFEYLENARERTAVRAFAAEVIYRNTAAFPELRRELKGLLDGCLPTASPGLRSKARRLLALLGG